MHFPTKNSSKKVHFPIKNSSKKVHFPIINNSKKVRFPIFTVELPILEQIVSDDFIGNFRSLLHPIDVVR